MNTYEFLNDINAQIENQVTKMKQVTAFELGLDPRAGSRFYIDDHCIVVHRTSERNLRYYGGFEYIDDEFRVQVGDYSFYFKDDAADYDEHNECRVAECLNRYNNKVETNDA